MAVPSGDSPAGPALVPTDTKRECSGGVREDLTVRVESEARANWRVARPATITSRRNVAAIQTRRGFRLKNASSRRTCVRPAAIQRSSIPKSQALCQRASGSLIRHVLTTCSSASEEPTGQTVENTIRSFSRIGVVRQSAVMRSKAWRPEIISYNTAPKLKMSDRASASRPASCSGDMSWTVPRTMPAAVSGSCAIWVAVCCVAAPPILANPKSSSFAPELVKMTLLGFRSRWTTPPLCAAASASAISMA